MATTSYESNKNEYLLGFASTQQNQPEQEQALPINPLRHENPYGVVMVDAAADISSAMAQHPRLRVLPLAIQWPGRTFMDKGLREKRGELRHMGRERLRTAQIAAPSVEGLEYRLYPNIAVNADWLIYIGSLRALNDPAAALQTLLLQHLEEIHELRRSRGLPADLQVLCLDGGSMLSGPALQARVLLKKLDAGEPVNQVAQTAAQMSSMTRQWLVPRYPGDMAATLSRLANPALNPWVQACSSGINKLWNPYPILSSGPDGLHCMSRTKRWRTAVAAVFAHTEQSLLEGGIQGTSMQISFDGSIRELQAWPEFARLRQQADHMQVRLHVTHMSLAGRIWASSGSLSLALMQAPANPADAEPPARRLHAAHQLGWG
ncbi:conserved hypothetical protein [Thiomonas sp. X19]|uniref:DegV family protein n=1 Tax=Thiomonas sp. X19 TaxID=1050370 RepID=UPI000B642ADE|nr:DegV family protein [Thiomonas sp. X19]SCC95011.1 conserved hypothetical protein [Thiomonas sp. X19]